MNTHKPEQRCARVNIRRDFQRDIGDLSQNHNNCERTVATPAVVSQCCTMAPITTTPAAQYDSCDNAAVCNSNCRAADNYDCKDFYLSMYGKEFVANTGKMIQNCICVKFNGLQDSCRHPDCISRIGCLDIPYPTCLPARQWKCDLACKNQEKLDCCERL